MFNTELFRCAPATAHCIDVAGLNLYHSSWDCVDLRSGRQSVCYQCAMLERFAFAFGIGATNAANDGVPAALPGRIAGAARQAGENRHAGTTRPTTVTLRLDHDDMASAAAAVGAIVATDADGGVTMRAPCEPLDSRQREPIETRLALRTHRHRCKVNGSPTAERVNSAARVRFAFMDATDESPHCTTKLSCARLIRCASKFLTHQSLDVRHAWRELRRKLDNYSPGVHFHIQRIFQIERPPFVRWFPGRLSGSLPRSLRGDTHYTRQKDRGRAHSRFCERIIHGRSQLRFDSHSICGRIPF